MVLRGGGRGHEGEGEPVLPRCRRRRGEQGQGAHCRTVLRCVYVRPHSQRWGNPPRELTWPRCQLCATALGHDNRILPGAEHDEAVRPAPRKDADRAQDSSPGRSLPG
eukprot:scaffold1658_cov393-Prasinococcus_capsulatus_cf.AAC.11